MSNIIVFSARVLLVLIVAATVYAENISTPPAATTSVENAVSTNATAAPIADFQKLSTGL